MSESVHKSASYSLVETLQECTIDLHSSQCTIDYIFTCMYRNKHLSKTFSDVNSGKETYKGGGWTYTLNCNGVVGDMLYLTDLDYTLPHGHNIAEVKIYGTG